MLLNQWAIKWGVPFEAIQDLRRQMGDVPETVVKADEGRSEVAIQTHVRLEASRIGMRLWRNNSGACYDSNGNFIRYGLANDSEKMNKLIKSSDLIGITPVTIAADMVGHTIGQFTAFEVKEGGWVYTGTDREVAQKRFIELVISLGGRAAFISSKVTL